MAISYLTWTIKDKAPALTVQTLRERGEIIRTCMHAVTKLVELNKNSHKASRVRFIQGVQTHAVPLQFIVKALNTSCAIRSLHLRKIRIS